MYLISAKNGLFRAPSRLSSSKTISDEELLTYDAINLNRVLKSKGGDYDVYDDVYNGELATYV